MTSIAAVQLVARATVPLSVQAVIFDLDGTLLDSEPLYRRAFQQAAAVFGRTLDDSLYAGLIGMATPDRMKKLTEHFGSDFQLDDFVAEYYRQKQRQVANGIPLKRGALQLLQWLERRGIPAAIATASSEATARRHLVQCRLHHRFRVVATRDHVPRRKPDPDLFLYAAQALSAEPSACLVLEDSATGLEAADSAGMIPVLVPDLAPVPARIRCKSFAVLPDLDAVRAMLAES